MLCKIALAFATTTLVASLNATAATPAPDRLFGIVEPIVATKPLTIGLTVVHLNDDFWKGIAYGVEDEAKRSNVQLTRVFVAGAYGNVREQFAQLNTLKSLGVNVVVIGAAAFNGFEPVLKGLTKAGINVMAVGIPVNSPSVSLGIAQDDGAIGEALGEVACKVSPKGKVVTIPGPAGAEWARLRYVGFNEAAKKCPGMTVVPGAFGGGLTLQNGLTNTSDLLLKYTDTTLVYTPVISLGMGAAQAIRQLKSKAKVLTSALVPEAIPMIKDGRIAASVSEPGILMGRLIVQYAIRQAEGKPLPNIKKDSSLPYPYVLTPIALIQPNNIDKHPLNDLDIPPSSWSASALMK